MEEKSNKKFWKGVLTGALGMVLIIGIAVGTAVAGNVLIIEKNPNIAIQQASESDSRPISAKVQTKLNTLEKYVQSGFLFDIDQKKLEEYLYKGYIAGLNDIYSAYYTKEEFEQMNESISGTYYGIGVMVSKDKEGQISVVRVFENCPGAEAGILPNDRIVKVGDVLVTGMELNEVVKHIKGEEGTKVAITVFRESDNEYHEVEVERRNVENPTVTHEMLENQIGYLQITEFDEITVTQFEQAMQDLEQQGMQGLIIDVRNNPGGLLSSVVKILEGILPEGKIVYTKDKNEQGKTYMSEGKTPFTKPMAVLVNENSASAAEIFSGAIKDYKLGTLIGKTTFGKGIVQTVLPLSDGSALKMTVSRYYTPSGVCIHETGITPDIEVTLDEALQQQINIEKSQDTQLQKAIEIVNDKITKK
ncbi:MAG: S41 family peptidase [Clostridiales bacterium]|nr:S41 family peptidase [Clostridiales bacterium]